jgi:integrase/recombinase XerD
MSSRRRAPLSSEHEALLIAFFAEEAALGRRMAGITGLKSRTPRFLRFLEERGTRAQDVTLADAYAYQGAFVEGAKADGNAYNTSSILAYVDAAHALCTYLVRSGIIVDNPFKNMRRLRAKKRIPTGILNEKDMARLLASLAAWNDVKNLKDANRRYLVHVVSELQYASGLRSAEVAALTNEDVDVDRALIHVRDGKKGSKRIGFLTDYAACVLERYMTMARPLLMNRQKIAQPDRLFFMGGDRFNHVMNEELSRVCREQGLSGITSHGFRHALGYHLLRSGCPLRYIQAILGHKRIHTTEIYTKVDIEDVKQVFDACHPRMHG